MIQQRKNQHLLFITIVFFWFAQYVYIPYHAPFLTEIGVSAGMVGMIVSAYGISQVILRLPIGMLADCRNRHKQFIMIGGFSAAAASVFRVLMQNGTGFFIANLFSGLASAMWISFMVLYMSYDPQNQQRATGQAILACNLGMLLGFITSTFSYQFIGMRGICLFSVAAGLLCTLTGAMISKGEEVQETLSAKQLLTVCADKRLLLFSFLALIQQGVQMATALSFTSQIIRDLGADAMTLGMASIIYMISAVFWAKFASTDACSRFSAKSWIAAVFCITAVYCLFVPICGNIYIICLLQILPGMSTGILFTFLTAEAMKHVPPQKKSTAMGFYQAVYALGLTIFPAVCGKIAGASSMTAAYIFMMFVCLAAAGISLITADKCDQ